MPFFINYLLIFGFAGSSLLHGLFSSCSKRGLLSSCNAWASHCSGFCYCGARAPGYRLPLSCGTQAYFLFGMRDLPRPGIEPLSSALAGRFFTTEPPWKSRKCPSWNPCVPWRIVENWSMYFYMCHKFLLKYNTIQKRTQILGSDSVMFHRVVTLMSPAPRSCTGVFLTFQKPLWPQSLILPPTKGNSWADI